MRRGGIGYRPDIDGMRALAVVLVIAFHAFPNYVPGGFVGVDVFFVISGFLITSLIRADLARGTFSLTDFFARRFRRLLPALILVLAATLAAGGALLFPGYFARIGIEALAGATFTSNFLYWSEAGYFDAEAHFKPLLHLWSLGVEEQFYLIWAPLMVLFARSRTLALILLVAAASFAVNLLTVAKAPAAAFFLLPSRLWELLLGAALTYAAPAPARLAGAAAWSGLAMVLAAGALIAPTTPYPGVAALLPTVGTALFIWAGPQALPNRLYSARWVVLIGLVSYPLYLWHWPLLSIPHMMRGSPPPLLMRGGLVAAAFLLAWLTYKYVERPIREWTPTRLRLRRIAVALCVGALALGGAGYAIARNDGLAGRFPEEVRALLLAPIDGDAIRNRNRWDQCFLSSLAEVRRIPAVCVPDRPDVLIMGDSAALHLYTGFAALKDGLSIAQLTAAACPPLVRAPTPNLTECVAMNKVLFETAARLKPRLVVVLGNPLNLEYIRQLPDALAAMKAAGIPNLHLMGPLPQWRMPLQHALFRLYLSEGRIPERTGYAVDARFPATDERMERIAREAGVNYASPREALCNGEGCLALTPERALAFWRFPYLTPEGSKLLVEALFGDIVRKAPS